MSLFDCAGASIRGIASILSLCSKRAGQIVSIAILPLCLAVTLTAQINTATVGGTITDPSGAAVGGATVVVENSATGVRREVQTNDAGVFSVPQLQPGGYQVTVTKEGFRTVKNSDIQVVIDQVANLPITLEVGATQQTVDVTGSAPIIETSTAGLGTVIGHKETVDLPLNGRQFTQLLQLAPGTVPIDLSQNNGKQPSFGSGAPAPAVNGQTNRSNLYFIDGIFATNPFFTGFSLSPSIDAIQEFKEQ